MKVHILVTCRLQELLPMTLLVFRSIRVGFPTAQIILRNNNLPDYAFEALDKCREQCGAEWAPENKETIHHVWIEELFHVEHEPFWILDTDVIFYDEVESWKFDKALAGCRIPEWFDQFTGTVTRARLHTSLLRFDPWLAKANIDAYYACFPDTPFNPKVNLFYPLCWPWKNRGYFSDTCSFLYHAIGGQAFTDDQLDSYFHANFGTISDIVLPRLPKETADAFRIGRAAILQNPTRGKGAWRFQQEFYKQHPS